MSHAPLKPHQPAPQFSAQNQHHKTVNLSDFTGHKNVVLYFYPKDDTPGCTLEANQFTERASEFAAAQTVILGVSRDSCQSHQAFIDKYGLQVDLLADPDGELCKAYGVWQLKEKNGEQKMGIVRSTFVIDKQGQIVEALYGVAPEGHAAAMLERIKSL
jgi:peroxiredoxin